MSDSALGARIVPANKASWDDLEAILAGASCHGGRCYCQRFKLHGSAWPGDALDRAQMLREQTDCGHPRSATTSGLVAYLDGEPAGWCNVEPRTAYPYLLSYALARAAVDFARERGARALEGYPMIPERGKDVAWGELNVGHVSIFTAAGFAEASRPTLRRAVMRIDF